MSLELPAVAVATRDRPQALARCLDALLGGTARPAEIVVVDQGETSAAAVAAERDVAHVAQASRGLSASRNEAIRRTSAPVIAFTDDDCVPAAGWVAAIARALESEHGAAAVAGPVLPLGPDEPGRHAVSTRLPGERRTARGRVAPWSVGTGANVAVRRDWLDRLGGYDERLGAGSAGRAAEDIDLIDRILRAGGSVVVEPDALVLHERADSAKRAASRGAYGHGIGAFCALAVRRRDPHGLLHLGRWLALRIRLLASALARGRWGAVREELAVLAGTARGLLYGARA